MHRALAGHNPYHLLILPKDNSTNFTTLKLPTIEHMTMIVVKSNHIQGNGQVYGSLNYEVTVRTSRIRRHAYTDPLKVTAISSSTKTTSGNINYFTVYIK